MRFADIAHTLAQERLESKRKADDPPATLLDAALLKLRDDAKHGENQLGKIGRDIDGRRGKRLIAHAPFGHWKTTTFLTGLRCDGVTAPCVFDGPINGEKFLAYVEQILASTLSPGDVVIMDNLGSHKVAGVREAIEAVGTSRRFLPAYSPDLDPIEQLSAKFKNALRKMARRAAKMEPETQSSEARSSGYVDCLSAVLGREDCPRLRPSKSSSTPPNCAGASNATTRN